MGHALRTPTLTYLGKLCGSIFKLLVHANRQVNDSLSRRRFHYNIAGRGRFLLGKSQKDAGYMQCNTLSNTYSVSSLLRKYSYALLLCHAQNCQVDTLQLVFVVGSSLEISYLLFMLRNVRLYSSFWVELLRRLAPLAGLLGSLAFKHLRELIKTFSTVGELSVDFRVST